MTYKTIVVHLDKSPRCDARVELAIRLAAQHGGRLVGVAPAGLPDVIVTVNSAVPDQIECVALSAAYLRQCAQDVARRFEERCTQAGAHDCQSRVVADEAIDAIVQHGKCSDLIVVGQSDRRVAVDGVAFDFPQQVLLHSGAPVLIVPNVGTFADVGRRALVAWKDTREAARALRDAIPMLQRSERVVLLEVIEAQGELDPEGLRNAATDWLASHGIVAEKRVETGLIEVGIGDELLSRAADLDADLIVMGGYGHGRTREWVLGGATRHLLAHMTVPTLMSH